MITYVKLKCDILGVIWRSFWGIYTHAGHLRVWILHGDWVNDSPRCYCQFLHFQLLKFDRIFGKNLEHDTYGVKKKSLTQHFLGGHYQFWPLKFMLVFFFMTHLSSYDNIFEIETWYFWDNIRVLLWYLYTHWASEGVGITRRLTKW